MLRMLERRLYDVLGPGIANLFDSITKLHVLGEFSMEPTYMVIAHFEGVISTNIMLHAIRYNVIHRMITSVDLEAVYRLYGG